MFTNNNATPRKHHNCAKSMMHNVVKLSAVVTVMFLGSTIYQQYMDPFPYELDGDVVNLKYIIHQLTRGLRDLNVKNQRLQGEIETISAKLPALELVQKSKTDITASNYKKILNELDIRSYDWQIPDFALESAGGKILNTGNTKPYVIYDSVFARALSVFASAFCMSCEEARAIIQPSVLPGDCWAFSGSTGEVTIQLIGYTHISGMSIEHIPVRIAPTKEISPAPRSVSLEGLKYEHQQNGHNFGTFEFDENGISIQYFDALYPASQPFNIVRILIHSNWGNTVYTCVYRIRIHGELASDD